MVENLWTGAILKNSAWCESSIAQVVGGKFFKYGQCRASFGEIFIASSHAENNRFSCLRHLPSSRFSKSLSLSGISITPAIKKAHSKWCARHQRFALRTNPTQHQNVPCFVRHDTLILQIGICKTPVNEVRILMTVVYNSVCIYNLNIAQKKYFTLLCSKIFQSNIT